jgi:two-component system, response regulator YesN
MGGLTVSDKKLYKVVVVEDEPFMLKNIIKKIEDGNSCFKVVGSADNGEDAIGIMAAIKPHVLFTDIRMPIMDGLELIRQVKKDFPEMHIIIISGYNEFDYAQEAIKLGAKNYLLKPVKMEQLQEILDNIKLILDAKTSRIEKEIITANITTSGNGLELPYNFSGNCFIMFLLCFGNLSRSVLNYDFLCLLENFWNKIEWDGVLSGILKDGERWWIIDEKLPNQKFIIISSKNKNNYDAFELGASILQALEPLAKPFALNVSLSAEAIQYGDIWSQAQKLRLIMDKGLVVGKSSILTPEALNRVDQLPKMLNASNISKISLLINLSDTNNLKLEVQSLIDSWDRLKYPQKMIERALKQLFETISLNAALISESELYHIEYELFDKLSVSPEFQSVYNDILSICEMMMTSKHIEGDNLIGLIEKVEEYLKNNYSLPISIEDISRKFNYSPSYLVKVFKKHRDITPLQFLINLRIQSAKQLMKSNSTLELKAISEIVGYSDPNYFSRIFKTLTNMSPSEYREQFMSSGTIKD